MFVFLHKWIPTVYNALIFIYFLLHKLTHLLQVTNVSHRGASTGLSIPSVF